MKRSLDRAIAELASAIPALRAVVLSAAPDGLIAWSWSRDGEVEISLGFARLDRVATTCLESLGAAREGRSLMLTARDTWVVAWPLDEHTSSDSGARLVAMIVFEGELQNGMVLLFGRRVLAQLRAAVEGADAGARGRLRERLAELVLLSDDPDLALEQLAADSALDLRRLERLEELDDLEQRRVEQNAEHHLRLLRVANA